MLVARNGHDRRLFRIAAAVENVCRLTVRHALHLTRVRPSRLAELLR